MRQKTLVFWAIFGALTLLPAVVLMEGYFPLLDDFIMYRGYELYPVSYLFRTVRVLTSRPVANLLDVFLWSRFSEHLTLLFFLFTGMRIYSVFLLSRFFEKQGWAAEPLCVLLLLCPVGVEATGWLSAASRIVTGLLFMSLALWYLMKEKWWHYAVFLFLSFGCYEQFWLLGSVLSWVELRKHKKNRIWIPLLLACMLGSYTLICERWSTSPRMGEGLNFSLVLQMFAIWWAGATKLIPQSIRRGWCCLNGYLSGALVLLVLLLCFYRGKKGNSDWKMGFLLFLVSYLPFFVSHQGLSFRMLYLSFIGLSLMIPPKKWIFIPLAFFFCLGSAGELRDYQRAGQQDEKILKQIVRGETWEPIFYHDSSVSYGQHILSVTHSEWSLTAGLRAITKKTNEKEVYP